MSKGRIMYPYRKLEEQDVQYIDLAVQLGISYRVLAKELGVSYQTISHVVHRVKYKHIPLLTQEENDSTGSNGNGTTGTKALKTHL